MSESPPAEPEGPAMLQRLPFSIETVYFDEWAPLGGPVSVDLSQRCTILVGRNGGGKSLLLEGIRDGARGAFGPPGLIPRLPKLSAFRIDIRNGDNLLRYRYEYKALIGNGRASPGHQAPTPADWREACWIQDPKQPLWFVEKGVLTLDTKEEIHLGNSTGSLLAVNVDALPMGPASASRRVLISLLWPVISVEALMPVRRHGREPITLKGDNGKGSSSKWVESNDATTANQLADTLWELFEEQEEQFEELEAVGQRIGIWQKLSIEKYIKERGRPSDVLAEVTVDGINLGLVSDGTLRLLKILLALVASQYSRAPLLIDEPELGIHPGLLGRLLAEFEAYGAGRQLVIATHSPQVVSWAKPEELRLVERVEGHTVVRSLSEEQAARVHSYLQDQGNLGEFVYGGGIDD